MHGKRQNRQFECSQLSRYTVPCDWTGDVCGRSRQAESQHASEVVCNGPYSYICNQFVSRLIYTIDSSFSCVVFHKFAVQFKVVSVTPLLKKNWLDYYVFANFWPLLNLHTFSKIIEQTILSRVTVHVESSLSYNRFQSAYRWGYLTETALTRLLNDVYINANQKSKTLLLLLDLSAAFDTYRSRNAHI